MLREILPPDTARAYPAMRELRTHLTDVEAFVAQVDHVQRPAGYRLVGAFLDGGDQAAAVVGFRLTTSLSWGRHLYVDDLSTLPAARGRGLAGRLLDWIHDEAGRSGCTWTPGWVPTDRRRTGCTSTPATGSTPTTSAGRSDRGPTGRPPRAHDAGAAAGDAGVGTAGA